MKTYHLIIGVLVLAILAALWYGLTRGEGAPVAQTCAADTLTCPDGSLVSRGGPACEFAACPAATGTTTTTTTVTNSTPALSIGASATVNGTTVRVLDLAEDSRCPVDVQCIQAGTVRVRVLVNATEATLTLGAPQTVGDAVVTLMSVVPVQKISTQTPAAGEYRFTFSVTS